MNDDANNTPVTPPETETPTTDQPPIQSPPPPKKEHPKLKRTLQVILIVVLAVLAAALTVFALKYSEPQAEPVKKDQSAHHAEMKHDHAKVIVDGANDLIEQKYLADNPSLKLARADKDRSPAYKTEGASFHVVGNIASTLTVTVDSDDQIAAETLTAQVRDDLTAYLASQDLKRTSDDAFYLIEYQDDTVICAMPSDFSSPYILSCANKSAYPELTAAMKPFADAMQFAVETVDDPTNLILFSPATIKDSPVEGYQNATVSASNYGTPVGGYAMLLYQNGDNGWMRFRATQSILSCEEFNKSDEIRNAFAGEPCIDPVTQQESTVQPADSATRQ